MVPYLTRRDILGGLFTVALLGSYLAVILHRAYRDDAPCAGEIVQYQERAERLQDELAWASMSGSQAECTVHRAYLAELEAFDARMIACGYPPSRDGTVDLTFQRRVAASKCPSL
jgi:hypothetical protein